MRLPRDADLGLTRLTSRSGLAISLLPNGTVFAIAHTLGDRGVMINQVLGSPLGGGIGGLHLRIGGAAPAVLALTASRTNGLIGAAADRFVWQGKAQGLRHRTTLRLHPAQATWFWRIEVENAGDAAVPCDVMFVQDLGLGERGFLMNNEAFASQYIDHHVVAHRRAGPVIMSRQNLAQDGRHPWVAHGCLDGAAGFATDLRQVMGPAHRDAAGFARPFGTSLGTTRLQHEAGCAALQSQPAVLAPGARAAWTFFATYRPDHPAASGDQDLASIDEALRAAQDFSPRAVKLAEPARSLIDDAPPLAVEALTDEDIAAAYPQRHQVEAIDGRILSFFVRGEAHERHVVLRDKERTVLRRHGALIRSGQDWLPSEETLCTTCWMHGVFAAQLTIGNTSFHKLFSLSRDAYNVTRASGLRILVDCGDGWRLLTVPSAFEIGLWDCRWIYKLADRTIAVTVATAGDEPAVRWRVTIEGAACRLLVFGQIVLGEREFEHAGRIDIDPVRKRFSFHPGEGELWSGRYPQAVYHLVTATPESVEAVGGDELLHTDGRRRSGGYAVIRTAPTRAFSFAVVGSLTSAADAATLADRHAGPVDEAALEAASICYWRGITRDLHLAGGGTDDDVAALDTALPWLVHDAMIHLTVPHGLEQYTGAAWGTRDVCQGPVELLLSLQHDAPVKAILRSIFAQQYETRGDWPQWFMLEPYSAIQDRQAHGDVIVWPLKALCDYLEETGDLAFLDEPVAWRRESDLERTERADPVALHIDKLLATVRERFVAGTHLIRYGNGDWNDSLQPVDPSKRDWMVSSWTVALLYQQVRRYAAILRRAGEPHRAADLDALAAHMRADFDRFLICDGTVAGYGIFEPGGGSPELLLHPRDTRTGVSYSLLPMTRAIIAGLFTPEQAHHHAGLIRRHLAFPDGVRLMDRPVAYHGGVETLFRRAESAAFFGREIGLMYVHAHLRYAEAMAVLGDAEAAWAALCVVNPVSVAQRLPHATPRQRNAYFSSSDAAFDDRYQAKRAWSRARAGTIPVDGGWRIYSSGPGLYLNMLIRHALGVRRSFGKAIAAPCLPPELAGLRLTWTDKAP